MIQIKLDERDIYDLSQLMKGNVTDPVKLVGELIKTLRKMNEDHDKFEISDKGVVKETISGSDLLLATAQNGRIRTTLYLQLYLLLQNRNEPYEILI